MMPPLGSSTISKRRQPCSNPFIRFPCSSWRSKCMGGWCPASCSKARWTVGMPRKSRASSMEPAYFSAPNQRASLPAASKMGVGSKPSPVTHAAKAARSCAGFCGASRFATKPATLHLAGRPPAGTRKRATSLEPVDHSTPRSMASQAWPAARSSRPGSSCSRRSIWKSSASATKTALRATPPSATAARMASGVLAARQVTWHS
mmetsp:Transcript_83213/g.269222  ORF Transcript_83213/g.269222 Transcript_83213/m.269222 type:complete len:204 (-) Transcript_83213:557-1168(-)